MQQDIQKLIDDLKAQGLQEEQILQSLTQMVQEGKLTEQDLEQAKQILAGGQPQQPNPEDEKAQAGNLFGLKF